MFSLSVRLMPFCGRGNGPITTIRNTSLVCQGTLVHSSIKKSKFLFKLSLARTDGYHLNRLDICNFIYPKIKNWKMFIVSESTSLAVNFKFKPC